MTEETTTPNPPSDAERIADIEARLKALEDRVWALQKRLALIKARGNG